VGPLSREPRGSPAPAANLDKGDMRRLAACNKVILSGSIGKHDVGAVRE
jgi:hypothetical protein